MNKELVLSTLPKTWVFDLNGTLLKHNGYKIDGHDTLLPGALEYRQGYFRITYDNKGKVII